METTVLKIGTRGSPLALAQAGQVKALIEAAQPGLSVELVQIKTSGDTMPAETRAQTAIKGLFVKEIEEALLSGRIDLAIHSAKDLESDLPRGLKIAAVLKREDPRDALIAAAPGQTLKTLSAGTKVGVSSIRRIAQLKRLRRDLDYVPIQGNVDTRMRKLDAGDYGAIVLAACGLKRLGMEARISEYLDPIHMMPSPAQGALAIETRSDSTELQKMLIRLEDLPTRCEVEAERAFLKAMGGSCRVPIGALGRAQEDHLTLEAVVLSPDGQRAFRKSVSGSVRAAKKLGIELASHLRAVGADRLLYGAWAAKQ